LFSGETGRDLKARNGDAAPRTDNTSGPGPSSERSARLVGARHPSAPSTAVRAGGSQDLLVRR
jgi:hypothetical protein